MSKPDYPVPPFPHQQQDWPGLVSQMQPRPDHGETSYVGAGRLAGRRALITGGDSGIGRAVAIAFAREGADVAINYLPQEQCDANEVLELVRAAGCKGVGITGDLRSEVFCTELVNSALRELGGLDIVVNNAAAQRSEQDLTKITTEQFDSTFKTNVYATFWITRAAIPHLARGAVIINTSSAIVIDPPAILVDYAASKAAILTFSMALARQLAARGIRVHAPTPGLTWTPLQTCGGLGPEQLPNLGTHTEFGRPLQPVELAPIFVALANGDTLLDTDRLA